MMGRALLSAVRVSKIARYGRCCAPSRQHLGIDGRNDKYPLKTAPHDEAGRWLPGIFALIIVHQRCIKVQVGGRADCHSRANRSQRCKEAANGSVDSRAELLHPALTGLLQTLGKQSASYIQTFISLSG